MNAKTIDVLILESLANGDQATNFSLSRRWGEDLTKVNGWLHKFWKLGLLSECHMCPAHKLGEYAYRGKPLRIAEYLSEKNLKKDPR